MKTKLSNNKGMALLLSLAVLLFLSVISSALFIRGFSEQRTSLREKAGVQAYYSAEEGIDYAYGELAQADFEWYTHEWSGNTLQTKNLTSSNSKLGGNFSGPSGTYTVTGHYFHVAVYPELNSSGTATGKIIVHSQGTDSRGIATRTIESRFNKQALFSYFYFFPESRTFGAATYDGAGYGKIHCNGSILFSGSPKFTNMKELSAAGTTTNKNGYFGLNNSQYTAPVSYDGSNKDGISAMIRNSAPPYNYYAPGDLNNTLYKFGSGANASIDGLTLPVTLSNDWSWDKYSGDPVSGEKAVEFQIDNNALSWLVCNKNNPNSFLTADEYAAFQTTTDLNTFWNSWKTSHGYTDASLRTGDVARQYWLGLGVNPSTVNQEWWDDLTYGTDRSSGENIDVSYLNTKEQADAWAAWLAAQSAVTITKSDTGETETLSLSDILKDQSNGAEYLTPIGLDNDSYLKKAEDGGLALTKGFSDEYLQWANTVENIILSNGETVTYAYQDDSWSTFTDWWDNNEDADWDLIIECYEKLDAAGAEASDTMPDSEYGWNDTVTALEDAGIVSFTEIVNPVRQAYTGKSKVLEIDVAALRDYVSDKNFNGVIYVDDVDSSDIDYYDFSVLLKNAGVLPEEGLTVVTKHNIYVAGSFNLDQRDKGTSAYSYYQSAHPSQSNDADYTWRPAALISSNRLIYTVSDAFESYAEGLGSISNMSSYNYYEGSKNYPYSLQSTNFVTTYLNNTGLTGNNSPQAVKDFFAKYGLTLPASWTPANIKELMNPDVYPDAGTAQSALLTAGETKYDIATETSQPNRVSSDVIYNTAMVSPYDPQGYILERWVDSSGVTRTKTITGSFIELEASKRSYVPYSWVDSTGARRIDGGYNYWTWKGTTYSSYNYGYNNRGYLPYYSGSYNPKSTYAYEINFAKNNSGDSGNSLMGSSFISWLEIPNTDFLPTRG